MALQAPVEVDSLKRMRDTMMHRGPDDEGLYLSKNSTVGLGHRRLSIIDLSPLGKQPLSNEDGTVWVVCNGEIYNFHELRKELEGLGHTFRSRTDTEVIIHAYEAWGDRCVERFRGMFAFAIWDEPHRRLLLARDRIGIKPLFYYWDGKVFIFASELKGILGYPGVNVSLDPTALFDYLTYLYIPAPKTIYKQVRKLKPGHILTFEGAEPKEQQYWDLSFKKQLAVTEEEARQLLLEHLQDAVQSHLVSDVPVGVLLSGGLDSSTVVSFASANGNKLRTFTVGFDVAERSEVGYARFVAEHFHTQHSVSIVGAESVKLQLSNILGRYDEPYADSSAIPTHEVCRAASQQVKVALSGDGGDEVFAGYPRYPIWYGRQRWTSVPAIFRKPVFVPLSLFFPEGRRGYGLVRDLAAADSFLPYVRQVEIFTPEQKRRIMGAAFVKEMGDYDDYWYYRQYWRPELDPLTRVQYLDLKTYLPDDILTKVDRASMAVSLEVRPPLLDHKLVEFVFSLPASLRCPEGDRKYILRKVMQKRLPEGFALYRKQGFSVPWRTWGKKENPWMSQYLAGGEGVKQGILKSNLLEALNGFGASGLKVWTLVVLEGWLQSARGSFSRK